MFPIKITSKIMTGIGTLRKLNCSGETGPWPGSEHLLPDRQTDEGNARMLAC